MRLMVDWEMGDGLEKNGEKLRSQTRDLSQTKLGKRSRERERETLG